MSWVSVCFRSLHSNRHYCKTPKDEEHWYFPTLIYLCKKIFFWKLVAMLKFFEDLFHKVLQIENKRKIKRIRACLSLTG